MLHASSRRRLTALVLLAFIAAVFLPCLSGTALALQRAAPRQAIAGSPLPDALDWLWQALFRIVGMPSRRQLPVRTSGTCDSSSPGSSQTLPVPSPDEGISLDPNG